MAKTNDLAFLRLLCTSGIDIVTLMPVASECIKRLVPSFSLSMIRVSEDYIPEHHYSEHFDAFSHDLFASSGHHFSTRSDDPAAFANLLTNKVPYGTLIDSPPGFEDGAIYQHLFARNGIHHVLDVALRDAGGPRGILGIFRERGTRPFTRSDVATMQEIYPHLVHACAAEPLPARFDEIESAMLVAGRDGIIRWASPKARVWLETASVGKDRTSLMDASRLPEACRHLCQVWTANQSAHHRGSKATEVPEVTLPVPGGRVRLRAYGLSPVLAGDDLGHHVGIQLCLEMHRGLRALRALERSPLTMQQSRIALAHWQGQSMQAIKASLGVSASTLKSYHKEIYRRLDVNSAAELVRLVDGYADSATFDLARHLPRPLD